MSPTNSSVTIIVKKDEINQYLKVSLNKYFEEVTTRKKDVKT